MAHNNLKDPEALKTFTETLSRANPISKTTPVDQHGQTARAERTNATNKAFRITERLPFEPYTSDESSAIIGFRKYMHCIMRSTTHGN